MSILDTLVTDRVPGVSYGFQDMNRVGEAMEYVAGRLRACGFHISITARTDFSRTDFPSVPVFEAYIGLLRQLHGAAALPATSPPVPVVGSAKPYMTYDEANDIEQLLLDIDRSIDYMASAYRHCGAPVCGLEDLMR